MALFTKIICNTNPDNIPVNKLEQLKPDGTFSSYFAGNCGEAVPSVQLSGDCIPIPKLDNKKSLFKKAWSNIKTSLPPQRNDYEGKSKHIRYDDNKRPFNKPFKSKKRAGNTKLNKTNRKQIDKKIGESNIIDVTPKKRNIESDIVDELETVISKKSKIKNSGCIDVNDSNQNTDPKVKNRECENEREKDKNEREKDKKEFEKVKKEFEKVKNEFEKEKVEFKIKQEELEIKKTEFVNEKDDFEKNYEFEENKNKFVGNEDIKVENEGYLDKANFQAKVTKYLSLWQNNITLWKFNLKLHKWLVKHIFENEHIPVSIWSTVVKYIDEEPRDKPTIRANASRIITNSETWWKNYNLAKRDNKDFTEVIPCPISYDRALEIMCSKPK